MEHDSVKEFNLDILNKLNIVFQGIDIFLENEPTKFCSDLYIQDLDSDSIANFEDNSNLNVVEKTICIYLCYITSNDKNTLGADSWFTEIFIKLILQQLGLVDYPIKFELLPLFELRIEDNIMLGIPEFSMIKGDLMLIVGEEKHFKEVNEDTAWGERRLAGEMIATAFNKFYNDDEDLEIPKDTYTVYGIKVISTRFMFYKTTILGSYLDSLSREYPHDSFTIYRYPDIGEGINKGFDYMIPSERSMIVNTLCQLASLFT